MHDSTKTYQELIEEISILKQRNQELAKSGAGRKRTEAAMSDTKIRYRMLFEHSPDGIVIIDPFTARPLEFNETAHRQLGYSREEFQQLSISDIDASETPDEIRSHIQKVLCERRCDFETIHRTREGEIRNIHVTAQNTELSGRSVYHCIWRDITRQKQEEETLRESEEKYRLLIENSHDIIYTLTTDGVFSFVSPSWTTLLGHPVTQVVGQPYHQFVHPDDLAGCMAFMQSVIETGKRQEGVEYRVRHNDGSWYWHTSSAVPLKNQDSTIVGFEGIARDITAQKQLEEKLKSSEENFRTFFNSVDDMIIVGSPDGRIMYSNRAMTSKLGYSPDEFKNMHVLDVHPAKMRQEADGIFAAMFKGELDFCPLPLQSKTGALIPAETRVWFGKWSGKGCIFGSSKDLTKEQEALQKFNRLFNSNPSPMAVSSVPEGRFTDVNEAFLKTLGYSRGEIISKTSEELGLFVHPDKQSIAVQQLQTQGFIGNCELMVKRKDGTMLDGVFSGQIIENQEGKCLLTVMVDQTKRKRAEELLRESEARWQFALEGTGDGVWDWNTVANRVQFSGQWKAMLGYAEHEIGDTLEEWDSRVHPDDKTMVYADLERHFRGETETYQNEHRVLCKDGSYLWILDRGKVIEWTAEGKPQRVIGTHADITERKQMGEEILRAHKLESLGVLAGGIAHDFNNLMAIAQGYIELALMDLSPEHVSRQRLLSAMDSIEHTRDLTSRLITFSRGGGPHMELLDVTDIIRDAVQKTAKGSPVRVVFDFMENLWPAEVDEQQMKQCFYNLTTNAMEAMPEGGHLTITAENVQITVGENPDMKEGSYLKITVADNGTGIPEELLLKIFDPYFSTKRVAAQKGLGLGLAICFSVLKNHHGHITVKSKIGKGTSFILYLQARAELAKGRCTPTPISTSTFRLLIMDDEPQICTINRAHLEQMGYEVTDVKEGQGAIDAYKKALDSGNPFHLLMLDLTVRQGMGGQLAMERLLKIDPSARAIIVSGYVDDPVIEHYGDYGFLGALKKPFKKEELEHLVKNVLHGR